MRVRQTSFVGAVVVGGLVGWFLPRPAPTLTFLSVGQGSCAVLRSGGRTVLFDAGPKTEFIDGGERFVLPKLRGLGVSRVDVVVLSHPDLDHAGGLAAVMKTFPDARILANAGFSQEEKLPKMLRSLGVSAERVGWLPPFARLSVGSLAIDLASPRVVAGADDNTGSVLARIDGGAFIGGDAPAEVERSFENWIGPVSVMAADHHGSRTSGDPSFLGVAHPKWIVISVGRNNRYGHPNPEAVSRYQATGAKIYRTDRDGDVGFVLQDGQWLAER